MADILALWEDFSAGHWGTLGPRRAPQNAYGGVNMLLNRQGNLAPATASRSVTFSTSNSGRVWGMVWAWGLDGRVYYVQQNGSAATYSLRAFTPDPNAVPLSITTLTGTLTGPLIYAPDAVQVQNSLYLTIWGDKTYTVTPASNSYATLTGAYGNAPAGRCIALYGERIVVGGVNDTRFGNHPSRIIFSGDDTNNNPTLKTAWESLNFFDVGTDDTPITALLPMRDGLIVILQDQQIWTVTGVPGVNGSLRRAYGFHKGINAIQSFQPNHGVVDPSQNRIWMFDHVNRGIARFNGGTYTRVTQFGAPRRDRTGVDLVEGAVTSIGGPDEFVFHGVQMPRSVGEAVVGESMELVRLNNAFNVVQRDVLAGT